MAGARPLPRVPGRRSRLLVLGLLLAAACLVSLCAGAVAIDPPQVLAILAARVGLSLPVEFSAQQESVMTAIRLPRIVLGVLVGAGLGVAGSAMQGLYRSPLADPALVGIGAGAALGAVLGIGFGIVILGTSTGPAGAVLLTLVALVAALLASAGIYRVASASGRTVVATMLLAGIALNALFAAGTGVIVVAARDPQLRDITFWTLGSLASATWRSVAIAAAVVLPAAALLLRRGASLDALALGEAEAAHLGVDVRRLTVLVVALIAVAAGGTVAVAGVIGFVGLVVPNVARRVLGAGHRAVLPGSILLGATLVVLADVVARMLASPAELPIGLVTAMVGGPMFLWLLARDRGAMAA